MIRARVRALALALALASWPAAAHMMPAHHGTLNVRESSVFGVLAVPLSAVSFVDDDRDGRASASEIATHEAELQEAFRARYALTNQGNLGTFDLVLPRAEHDERDEESLAGAPLVLVLSKVDFDRPPTGLRLTLDLFGEGGGDDRFTITATRGADREVAHLTRDRAQHAFFETPGERFLSAVALGFRHIAEGFDHLLFVLTVVAGLSWGRILAVVTAFTVAHSLTLALAVTQVVRLPGRVVEPLIAASLVLVAATKLAKCDAKPKADLVVLFACGLVHGLGFASALGDLGLAGTPLALALAGFNVGLELGQCAFVLALVASWGLACAMLARFGVTPSPRRATVLAAATGGVGGLLWLAARVAGVSSAP